MTDEPNDLPTPEQPLRKLVETFPGLPPGAGFYDDGYFYNCAPGQEPQDIDYGNVDVFYSVDPHTNEIIYDTDHPCYTATKNGLELAGYKLENIKTVEELEYVSHIRRGGWAIYEFLTLLENNRERNRKISNEGYAKMRRLGIRVVK